METFDWEQIVDPLLTWYAGHARVLPWREHITPYRVWISEIMLQQTRVEAVKPYFERFMAALPTIPNLAECEEDRLLKLWEGLGYYNRVRNLQAAACTVVKEYGGELPADYDALLSLKGIGPYTAGAISSIAFGLPVPAVDGNVLRVIMRVSADRRDITKLSVRRDVEQTLRSILPADRVSSFNQALMELGAIICVPNGEPLCSECPWSSFCEAKRQSLRSIIPVKKKAAPRRIEKRTILLIRDGERVVLNKRPNSGLLAGLYEFPNLEGHLNAKEVLEAIREIPLSPLYIEKLPDAKHIFSHVEWHMQGYLIQVDSLQISEAEPLFVPFRKLEKEYALPSAFESYKRILTERSG